MASGLQATVGRASSSVPTYRSQPRPTVTDDYERWYTEQTPNNRMLLALQSEIDTEISWALDRLMRLCHNEQFLLASIPGLTRTLFIWPEWYVAGGFQDTTERSALFSLSPSEARQKKHALEAMFILRNAALNEPNANELAAYPGTRSLILFSLHRIKPDTDSNTEFTLYIIELLQSISKTLILPPPNSPLLANPLPPLQYIAESATDRSLIITSLITLNLLLSNPSNVAHLTPDTPALAASVRYLPLHADKPLSEACLNYLYTHLSYPPMTKAFLLHPELSAVLRLLVIIMLSEQVEETVSIDIAGQVYTAPAQSLSTKDHDLTQEELDHLVQMFEPQRCFEWMKLMFVARPDGEVTQVDFWNLYKDTFSSHPERSGLLAASEVIKNVNTVFPQAQAMVLNGPPQKFVVRGVDRRKDEEASHKFRCLWNRSQCPEGPFNSTSDLYEHVLESHINFREEQTIPCMWASCPHEPVSKSQIRGHVLTHFPTMQPPPRHPSQLDTITLPSQNYPHPIPNPTSRPPPPPRLATITYQRPVADPPSTSLTALLCIRVLFRASFASSDAAPRVDEDHFGFPGIIEDTEEEDQEERSGGTDIEKEGERRGRKAFVGIRHLLEGVRIRDDALMGWIMEMVDAGISGTT